jgi:ABC-type glycerol-3-phosphate transport system permease component
MKKYGNLIFGIIGWVVAVIIFFPIFWMAITAFKTEQGAYSPDLIFVPTLDSFKEVFSRSNYLGFMMNSIYVSLGSTLVCLIFAIPCAYKMSFFLEAGRIDGASVWEELWHLLRPMSLPGLSSTALILIIFAWNEAFWSINLTSANAAPLTSFIASYSSPEGLFWAKLSAASLLAVAPIMVLGWLTQKQLVQGLTFGAVK